VLVLTHDAATVIRSIVEQSDVPEQGGLRITAQPVDEQQAALQLAVAQEPDALDEVVEQEGAQVFLEPVVAQALADKVLDASVEDDGVRFTIHEQPEGPEGPVESMNGDGAA
jgi:Fe-S cluster assembly iron-binding protein IscA